MQADATAFDYPDTRYELITISFFRVIDRLSDIKAALAPNSLLFYQHHLRADPLAEVGPSTDRYRFAANELLHVCLDLTVLYYEESCERRDDERSTTVEIFARNRHGTGQAYPETEWRAT